MSDPSTRIARQLTVLYGEGTAAQVWPRLAARLDAFRASHPHRRTIQASDSAGSHLTERDAILITYGDQLREPGQPPLRSLRAFLDDHLRDAVSGVHILPCFPYSSDDGFSVID